MGMYSGIGSFAKKFQTGGEAQTNGSSTGSGAPTDNLDDLGNNATQQGALSREQFLDSLTTPAGGGQVNYNGQIMTKDAAYDAYLTFFQAVQSGNFNFTGANVNASANVTRNTLPPYMSFDDAGNIVFSRDTTNRQFIEGLNMLGLLSTEHSEGKTDYEWLLEWFDAGSEGAESSWLATHLLDPDRVLDFDKMYGVDTDLTAQNQATLRRLNDIVNNASVAGGFFEPSQTFRNKYADPVTVGENYGDGTGASTSAIRPVFIGQPPTGGTAQQPYYSVSDVLVSSSEQPNLYDRFNPYPVGDFKYYRSKNDPYQSGVTTNYGYQAPGSGISTSNLDALGTGLVFETEQAEAVDPVVDEAEVVETTQGTGGTGVTVDEDFITGDTATGTTDTTGATGTTQQTTTSVQGLPAYDDIYDAVMDVEGYDPISTGTGISGMERSYQRKRSRGLTNDLFRQYLGRNADSEALSYYGDQIYRAFSLGGRRGRLKYEDIIDEIRNSEEGQLFSQRGGTALAPTMDYYAEVQPFYADRMAEIDFSQEYLNPADFAGVDNYIYGKRGILGGQQVKQGSLRNLSAQEFMDVLAGQSGTGAYGGDLIYDPDRGIIYSGVSDRMDEARQQAFMNQIERARSQSAVPFYIDPSLMTDTELFRFRGMTGGYGKDATRIGDTQYFVNDDGTISAVDVKDIEYGYTPGFAEGGIVDVYDDGMVSMKTTGEGIESFLNPERSKATLRRNLAKLAPRPTAPVMQQGIMPMAR